MRQYASLYIPRSHSSFGSQNTSVHKLFQLKRKNQKNSCVLPLHISNELQYKWQGPLLPCITPPVWEDRLSGYRTEHQTEIASLEKQIAREYGQGVLRNTDKPAYLIRAPYEGSPCCSHSRKVCRLWPLLPLRKLITRHSLCFRKQPKLSVSLRCHHHQLGS